MIISTNTVHPSTPCYKMIWNIYHPILIFLRNQNPLEKFFEERRENHSLTTHGHIKAQNQYTQLSYCTWLIEIILFPKNWGFACDQVEFQIWYLISAKIYKHFIYLCIGLFILNLSNLGFIFRILSYLTKFTCDVMPILTRAALTSLLPSFVPYKENL